MFKALQGYRGFLVCLTYDLHYIGFHTRCFRLCDWAAWLRFQLCGPQVKQYLAWRRRNRG